MKTISVVVITDNVVDDVYSFDADCNEDLAKKCFLENCRQKDPDWDYSEKETQNFLDEGQFHNGWHSVFLCHSSKWPR